jgi:hypothetical protein
LNIVVSGSVVSQVDRRFSEFTRRPDHAGYRSSGLFELSESRIRSVVLALAKELRDKYVYPEVGNKMAGLLEGKIAQNAYSSFMEPEQLAFQLENDLFALCRDKHLHIVYRGEKKNGEEQEEQSIRLGRSGPEPFQNHGFTLIQFFPGGVGYLKLDTLSQGLEAEKAARSAVTFLSGCRTLIIDLRSNRGGSAWMVQYICSYLFSEPTHLFSLFNRSRNETREVWTIPEVQEFALNGNLEVYVLIGPQTFSGAEGLAYTLKHLGRAKIVGENSGGGAHPMIWIQLPCGFDASIPNSRVIHPVTQSDWEGTGVEPDYRTVAADAFVVALRLAQREAKGPGPGSSASVEGRSRHTQK